VRYLITVAFLVAAIAAHWASAGPGIAGLLFLVGILCEGIFWFDWCDVRKLRLVHDNRADDAPPFPCLPDHSFWRSISARSRFRSLACLSTRFVSRQAPWRTPKYGSSTFCPSSLQSAFFWPESRRAVRRHREQAQGKSQSGYHRVVNGYPRVFMREGLA